LVVGQPTFLSLVLNLEPASWNLSHFHVWLSNFDNRSLPFLFQGENV
jgi:hypothetical protein